MTKVIKFYANWCGPCKVYGKTFDKVEKNINELYKSVEFLNVDIEKDTSGLAAKYKVGSIPFTVVEKDGLVKTHTGRMNEDKLNSFILDE